MIRNVKDREVTPSARPTAFSGRLQLGMIGLGRMGGAMTQRLLLGGHALEIA